jgi:hypothetical protein
MNRFRRWLFNGLASVSLLLCLAMGNFAIRSIFRFEQVEFTPSNTSHYVFVSSYCGTLEIGRVTGLTENLFVEAAQAILKSGTPNELGPLGFLIANGLTSPCRRPN